jgi:hypothetical protein
LLSLDKITFSCERNIAIRTALHLSNIVGRHQIYRSVRRAKADTGELGPKCMANHPKNSGSLPRGSGSKKIAAIRAPSTA